MGKEENKGRAREEQEGKGFVGPQGKKKCSMGGMV